jgi:dipeptidyl-peptidase-4
LPDHHTLRIFGDNAILKAKLKTLRLGPGKLIKLESADHEQMDASIIFPPDFDVKKRYPLFFEVYGEPAGTTVHDQWEGFDYLFHQMIAQKGYIVASVDNRGTPTLKGRKWRKSVYKKIGIVASDDQAAAAKQLSAMPFVDPTRIGIWGWSGGGSMTLNMLFRYPELYALGMSVAPVPDTRLYDTIYQERYMGTPQDNPDAYRECSPITFAKQLKGNLLIVHGSGDDNVHYQGTERLINELVADNKPFQLMVYPNRTHSISEGAGTTRHLYELLLRFLTTNMPPGGR